MAGGSEVHQIRCVNEALLPKAQSSQGLFPSPHSSGDAPFFVLHYSDDLCVGQATGLVTHSDTLGLHTSKWNFIIKLLKVDSPITHTMNYCTSSLKPFPAQEVWDSGEGDDSGLLVFSHISIVAVQKGEIYQGTSKSKPKDTDKASVIKELSPVPRGDVFPPCSSNLTRAPEIYIKIPNIALYAPDAKDIIPQRLLHEAKIYELLREHPHPNLGQSLGCVVGEDGRLGGLALFKYKSTHSERTHDISSFDLDQREQCIAAVKSALEHLHSWGLAHNDLSLLNIMFTDKGEPVLLDFDTCHPVRTELKTGGQIGEWKGIPRAVYKASSTECDLKALEDLDMWLENKYEEMKESVSNE
ncbi:hypothetical protein FACUT_5094 [Fusarium acutatum]|uniref:Protein kinase domain-containing protein n=1 Tax=Fusarium acutatum TaxID=78861 RepID=A0A8H4JVC3_9HYPO|nr:hypothetical protein FACUT_5094 [Fusarium acutatum]